MDICSTSNSISRMPDVTRMGRPRTALYKYIANSIIVAIIRTLHLVYVNKQSRLSECFACSQLHVVWLIKDPVYMLPLIPPLMRETKLSLGVTQWVCSEHAPSRTIFKVLATALLAHRQTSLLIPGHTFWLLPSVV